MQQSIYDIFEQTLTTGTPLQLVDISDLPGIRKTSEYSIELLNTPVAVDQLAELNK